MKKIHSRKFVLKTMALFKEEEKKNIDPSNAKLEHPKFETCSFTLLFGGSGSGKSSFILRKFCESRVPRYQTNLKKKNQIFYNRCSFLNLFWVKVQGYQEQYLNKKTKK